MQPAAHFFTAYTFDEFPSPPRRIMKHGLIRTAWDYDPGLAAPSFDTQDSTALSWTKDNPSAYLIDSALWTTCCESRQAMERRFGPMKPNNDINALNRSARSNPAVTARFLLDGMSRMRYLSICPQSDLYCVQPFFIDGLEMFYDELPMALSKFSTQPWITHLAFEHVRRCEGYCQRKDHLSYRMFTGALLAWIFLYLHCAKNIWLIDYRLKRCKDVTRQDRYQFYGNGYRYVEVWQSDEEWTFLAPTTGRHDLDGACCNTFLLVRKMFARICRRAAQFNRHYRARVYAGSDIPNIRVLACEKLGR